MISANDMMLKRSVIICCMLFFIQVHAKYPFLNYKKENGLPSNMVYDLYRDSRGFMWISTDKGIARFDGISFQTFNTADGLPDNEVFSFQEDYYNRIWLSTYSGALCYYKNGVFHNAKNTPFLKIPFIPDVTIRNAVQSDSSIIVYYKKQKTFINLKDNSCRAYERTGNEGKNISCPLNIYKISDSVYSILYDTKQHHLNVNTGKISNRTLHKNIRLSTTQNQEFLYDEKHIYDRNFKKLGEMPCPAREMPHVNRIYFDGKNYLVATDDGIYINNRQLFKGMRVASITQDIAGCYWIATLGNGIYRISRDFEKSCFISNAYSGAVTYATNYTGVQYFATSDRHLYELKDSKVKMLLDFSEGIPNVRNQGKHIDCAINKHLLYCIGRKGTIFSYNILTKEIKRFILPEHHRKKMISGRWKYLMATSSGLHIISPNGINFIPYTGFSSGQYLQVITPDEFRNRLYAVTSDNNGHIVHSRSDGVYFTRGSFTTLHPQFGNRLFFWLKYHHNTFVGCTPANELFLFRNEGAGIRTDSFFFKKTIWDHAYPLSSGQLLLTSNRYYYILSLPDSGNSAVRPIPVENPFIPTDASYILSSAGNCCFFKGGNITIVNEATLSEEARLPALYFDKIVMNDSIFMLGNGDSVLTLGRSHATAARISFEILSFNAADAEYEYCLVQDDGKPSKWEQITNKELNLVLPRFGIVKILARTKNHKGAYSNPQQFTIVILKPWWASWWGIMIMSFLLIVIVGSLVYYIMRSALKRKEAEHNTKIKLMNAEFKTLNAMMNPHFIFNTLNNIQSFINKDNKRQANAYIRTFSDMVRQNMLNISKEMVTLTDEMATVEAYLKLQRLRFKHISYHIDIKAEVDTDGIMVPPLLIQPLVENSIQHGILPLGKTNGHIGICISETKEIIRIEITDNGVGISRSATHSTSFAIDALKKRINTMCTTQNISITFEINDHISPPYTSGTRVLLTVSGRS